MDRAKLLECIHFFNSLSIQVEEVTSQAELAAGNKVVYATYSFKGKDYKTKKLFYKKIEQQEDINKRQEVLNHFGEPVYWLDISIHDWPRGKGEAEIDHTVIKDMIAGDNPEFENLLQKIANNNKNGFLQAITNEGRSQQYGFNLTNNNHWHDLILLVKEIIKKKGEAPAEEYYKNLIFNWVKNGQGRQSLSKRFGSRSLIDHLLINVKSIQSMLDFNKIEELIKYKKQIILQGPPGTGKTYIAKKIAHQMVGHENEEQFKIIQFHPSYTYEDFVRGITAKSEGGNIIYETEDKTLALFAKKAMENEGTNYVLIIDEINRANLPSVLGELIYALEYRNEAVESMYALDGENAITISENLYLIGTMNTADRSVGHIDYAIKRRFAFVDVLPDEKVITNEQAKALFQQVAALFVKEEDGERLNSDFLASDFDYKDVQLGHSYFMLQEGSAEDQQKELQLRLRYEILPILNEYVKDGLLLEEAKVEIKKISGFGG